MILSSVLNFFSPCHSRDGQDGIKKPDAASLSSCLVEGTTSFVGDGFVYGQIFDGVVGWLVGTENCFIGLSKYALIFGGIVGLFSATCSSLSHLAVNTELQNVNKIRDEENQQLLIYDGDIKLRTTIFQKIALSGEALSRTTEFMADILFPFALIEAQYDIPGWVKQVTIVSALVVSSLGSCAPIRSAYNAFIDHNFAKDTKRLSGG